MKILVTEPEFLSKKRLEELKSLGKVIAKKMDRKSLLKQARDIDIIFVRIDTAVDKELIDHAKKLKIIATPVTGLNHIDAAYAEEKGIKVISAPGMNTNTTAEHAFSLILSLTKKIPFSFESAKKGEWRRHQYISNELNGKSIGIIGLGRIGSRIAEFAKAFGMNVYAFDKYVSEKQGSERGAIMVELNELLRKSDIITIHCMLTDETRNMFSSREFGMMKDSAMLINASRGEVIDEAALLNALKKEKITGAALDVLAQEPPKKNSPLIKYAEKHENLIITPHIAGLSYESIDSAVSYVIAGIKEAIGASE
ncbi:MAG: hydroxyacid dehydrogenase [Candidatus Aenigmarchaeota archaeon]|nr:hydroxyacid dehydrogenase [Candidatus Aenigmarchaeota archaeon]